MLPSCAVLIADLLRQAVCHPLFKTATAPRQFDQHLRKLRPLDKFPNGPLGTTKQIGNDVFLLLSHPLAQPERRLSLPDTESTSPQTGADRFTPDKRHATSASSRQSSASLRGRICTHS